MIGLIKRLFSKTARAQHRHDKIVNEYRKVASNIGGALTETMLGEPWLDIGWKSISLYDPELYHILDALEEQYASLGYRIIEMGDWADYDGWGVPLGDLWLAKREEGERPKFTKMTPPPKPQGPQLLQQVWESGSAMMGVKDEDGNMTFKKVDK